jgi:hypothetical protein
MPKFEQSHLRQGTTGFFVVGRAAELQFDLAVQEFALDDLIFGAAPTGGERLVVAYRSTNYNILELFFLNTILMVMLFVHYHQDCVEEKHASTLSSLHEVVVSQMMLPYAMEMFVVLVKRNERKAGPVYFVMMVRGLERND